VVVDGVSSLACVWVPFFAAAAAIRAEPALAERPLAIVRGALAVSRVVEANAAARERGVAPGMTDTEARARCPDLARRAFAAATVTSAQHALLEAALVVSPRVEDGGPGEIYVDTTGLGRLMGDAAAIGRRLVHQAHAVGLPARVAVAGSRAAARVTVRTTAATVVVVPSSEERATLAAAPLSLLDLPVEVETTLARWGVRTLGELTPLPRAELGARLGPAGLRAHDLALGHDRTPFTSYVPPPFWQEAQSFDWEIDDLGALLRLLGAVLERLAARLTAGHLWADGLTVHLELASGARDDRAIALAYPAREAPFMLGVLSRELDAHRPMAPVTAVAVSVRPVVAHPGLSDLWQPLAPRQRDLAALTTRLVELVGDDNLGSAVPVDSHRPDAFVLEPFALLAEPPDGHRRATSGALVLRRLRPPRHVEVEIEGERPARVRWGERFSSVLASAGPWRASGDWWDTQAWAHDEWDLLLGDRTLCRLAHDRLTGHWMLDGVYD
jgi:protein ImuB